MEKETQPIEELKKVIDKSIINNIDTIDVDSLDSIKSGYDNEIELIKTENEDLKDRLDKSENKYKYLLADLENIKKRYNKQINDLSKYEGENVLKEIINFVDYLDLNINNSEDNEQLLEIKDKILSLLNSFDVHLIYDDRPIYFNDKYDEAILSKDCDDKNLDNSIDTVYQKGYIFKDKILRYEKVIVNKYKE